MQENVLNSQKANLRHSTYSSKELPQASNGDVVEAKVVVVHGEVIRSRAPNNHLLAFNIFLTARIDPFTK